MYQKAIEKLQVTWENFTDREKRIVAAAGAALFFFIIALPFMLMTGANSDLEQEIDDMKTLLDDIAVQSERLQQLVVEKRAAEKRYRQKAPQLGGFLESLAREQGLTIQEANDEPEKTVGNYRRRGVQVSIPKVALTPIIKLMAAVDSTRYPVAIGRIQIEHFQQGDTYNFRLGVLAFDKESAGGKETPGAGDEEDGEKTE